MINFPKFVGVDNPQTVLAQMDAVLAEIDARTKRHEVDLAGLVKLRYPPGTYTDPVGPNQYMPTSESAFTGITRLDAKLASVVPDFQGQVNIAQMNATRLAVVGVNLASPAGGGSAVHYGRTAVYDLDPATGLLTEKVAANTPNFLPSGYNGGNYYANLAGAGAVSPLALRAMWSGLGIGSTDTNPGADVYDITYDETANTLAYNRAITNRILRRQTTGVVQNISMWPKGAFLTGNNSLHVMELFQASSTDYNQNAIGLLHLERSPSANQLHEWLGCQILNGSNAAICRLSSADFAVARNTWEPSRGWSLTVELVRIGDSGPRPLGVPYPLANGVTSNLRLFAVGNILVVGYYTNAQYASYMLVRTDDTTLAMAGDMSVMAPFNQVPVTILSNRSKRGVYLSRGTGWNASAQPVNLDPDAAPVLQAAGPAWPLTLGSGLGVWAAADNVQITGWHRPTATGDLLVLTLYNYTRSQAAIETYKLTV